LQLSVWQEIVQYKSSSGSTLTVRYGPQEGYAVDPQGPTRRKDPTGPGLFFLLDSDSCWLNEEKVPEFKTDWILDRSDLLHEPAREFFKIAVSDKLRDEVFSKPVGGD